MAMRLLITRPEADAAPLAALLESQGHQVLLAPLLRVALTPDALPALDEIAALIFTSANGVRAFVAASQRRDLPCYAVGDRTASALRDAGFAAVESAAGDVETLGALIVAHRRPESGRLLHVAGSEVAGDLAGHLESAGFAVERAVLYETIAQDLDAATLTMIAAGEIDGVLFFSPRTAATFAAQIFAASLWDSLRTVTAWCLSGAVAAALDALPFQRVVIAETPTQDSLLALLATIAEAAKPETTPPEPMIAPPKDPSVTHAPPASPTPKRPSAVWKVYSVVVVVALAAGALSAEFWVPESWMIAHGWLKSPGHGPGPGPGSEFAGGPSPGEPLTEPPPMPTPPPGDSLAALPATSLPELGGGAKDAAAAPTPSPTVVDPRLDELTASVTALQSKLAALSNQPSADPKTIEGLVADQKSLAVGLATLEARVTAIEKTMRDADAAAARDRSLLIAAEELRQDLMSSAGFSGPLAVIATLGAKDPEIAPLLVPLTPHAEAGLPSREVLAQQLATLIQALALPAPLPANASWWRRLLDQLERLVVIRHVAVEGAPATPEEIARLAAADLDHGDLTAAAGRIATISGDAAAQVAPWLAMARARLAAEAASDTLTSLLSTRLAAPSGSESAP